MPNSDGLRRSRIVRRLLVVIAGTAGFLVFRSRYNLYKHRFSKHALLGAVHNRATSYFRASSCATGCVPRQSFCRGVSFGTADLGWHREEIRLFQLPVPVVAGAQERYKLKMELVSS